MAKLTAETTVRFTPSDLRLYSAAAADRGMTMADLIRVAMSEYVAGVLVDEVRRERIFKIIKTRRDDDLWMKSGRNKKNRGKQGAASSGVGQWDVKSSE